ncbi:MAG TPA: hypothetical protein V6D26_22630 [Stenomitos sp.]
MTATFPFAETENRLQELPSKMQFNDASFSSTKLRKLGVVSRSLSGYFFPSPVAINSALKAESRGIDLLESTRVIPLSKLSPWQLNTIRGIAKLANLPDNWDGYGSSKIQQKALETAFHLVLAIQLEEPPTPHISPVPGGGIQLEWQTSTRELELEILPDGSIEFLTVLEGNDIEEDCLPLDRVGEAQRLIYWLMDK